MRKDKPSPLLFLLMSAVYFGSYFGLKYGVFGGSVPWYANVGLIGGCLLLALGLHRRFSE